MVYRWHVGSLMGGGADIDVVPLIEDGFGERRLVCVGYLSQGPIFGRYSITLLWPWVETEGELLRQLRMAQTAN